jgi:hypothetical protein
MSATGVTGDTGDTAGDTAGLAFLQRLALCPLLLPAAELFLFLEVLGVLALGPFKSIVDFQSDTVPFETIRLSR